MHLYIVGEPPTSFLFIVYGTMQTVGVISNETMAATTTTIAASGATAKTAAAAVASTSFGGLFLEQCYVVIITIIGVCISCLWWVYGKTVTEPLRVFYFVGLWGNLQPEQVCFELTDKHVDSSWWTASPDRIEECKRMMTSEFDSFHVLVIGSLYIASLVFTVFYLFCRCCFLRPLLRELRGMRGGGAR